MYAAGSREERNAADGVLSSAATNFLAVMAEGSHPFPFRTRPLSPPAPMVLPRYRGGRVGRCQEFFIMARHQYNDDGPLFFCPIPRSTIPWRRVEISA